jgi:hypothetical protein
MNERMKKTSQDGIPLFYAHRKQPQNSHFCHDFQAHSKSFFSYFCTMPHYFLLVETLVNEAYLLF